MADSRRLEQLMECLIQVIGRATIPETRVREVVGTGAKQLKAFNLAAGTLTQSDIAKKAKLGQASLSRTFSRWVENGVAFWVGEDRDARLVHIYPIASTGAATRRPTSQKRRTRRPR